MLWDVFPLSEDGVKESLGVEYRVVRTSGPNSRSNTSSLGMCWYDALIWTKSPLIGVLALWLKKVDSLNVLATLKRLASEADEIFLLWKDHPKRSERPLTGEGGRLGKLGIKEEPGKVRVFAMVDYWTQIVLYPLHSWLFSVLK